MKDYELVKQFVEGARLSRDVRGVRGDDRLPGGGRGSILRSQSRVGLPSLESLPHRNGPHGLVRVGEAGISLSFFEDGCCGIRFCGSRLTTAQPDPHEHERHDCRPPEVPLGHSFALERPRDALWRTRSVWRLLVHGLASVFQGMGGGKGQKEQARPEEAGDGGKEARRAGLSGKGSHRLASPQDHTLWGATKAGGRQRAGGDAGFYGREAISP